MTLAAVQRDFGAFLIGKAWAYEEGPAAAGLAVHHHAYRAQLLACLRETFEKTWAWLGDAAFTTAAAAHIDANPPHGWTLGVYGDGFDATLAALYPDDPEVADLAWMDWALRRAFDGHEAAPLVPSELGGIDWDHAVLRLCPTLLTRTMVTNCAAIWSALAADEPPPPARILPDRVALRVWRRTLSPQFKTIDVIERDAIALVRDGTSFGALCARLSDMRGEDGPPLAGALLGDWLCDELIVDIDEAGRA